MKTTGIVRPVDVLGRIVLPIEIRRNLDIEERDLLEIFVEDDRIILRKQEKNCVFCGADRGLVEHHEKCVCLRCIKALSEKE